MNTHDIDINDRTRERIRAFIHSMRPLRGVADLAQDDDYQCGRALLERLADSAEGEDHPTLRFNTEQCAQVCMYLRSIEPFTPANWWDDPEDAPSHTVGLQFVLGAVADSLYEAQPAATVSDEQTNTEPKEAHQCVQRQSTVESADDRKLAMLVQLNHVYANLDVLSALASAKDSDLGELENHTLFNFLHSALEKVRCVEDYIASLPSTADAMLLQTIQDAAHRAQNEARPDYQQRYARALKSLGEAHKELESLRGRRQPIQEAQS